ncbi:MAG: hypothetical protein ACI9NQ_000836 [Paracoccaceae bacterium]|jgi:hypothetical protein
MGLDEKLANALRHLTALQRAEIEDRTIEQVITNHPVGLDGETLEFYSAGSYGEKAARELGQFEEIQVRIEAKNVESRTKLREILERMEAEAGQ